MKRLLPFFIIAVVLGGAILVVWYLLRSTVESPRTIQPGSSVPQRPASSIKPGADPPHMLGTTDAPVMLEEFGDFECQPCGLLHPTLTEMKREFGQKVVIVFREFPLVTKHAHALAAAQAAEAAGLQGKFWEMHDLLYENQKVWREASDVRPIFEEYATQIGLSLDRFRRDSSSDIVTQRITLDRERGYSIGVNSTPTVFLNGREVPPESLGTDKLRELIKAQIPPANRD